MRKTIVNVLRIIVICYILISLILNVCGVMGNNSALVDFSVTYGPLSLFFSVATILYALFGWIAYVMFLVLIVIPLVGVLFFNKNRLVYRLLVYIPFSITPIQEIISGGLVYLIPSLFLDIVWSSLLVLALAFLADVIDTKSKKKVEKRP